MQIDNNIEEQQPHTLEVLVSPDYMTAIIKVLSINNQTLLTSEEVIDLLHKNGITYGIREKEIEEYCKKGKYYLKVKAAIGTPAIQGEDAKVDFKFEVVRDRKPKENPDGTIDYKNLGLIYNVMQDELLCKIIPPKNGIDGTNIYGGAVIAKAGKQIQQIKAGKNTYYSEDNTEIYAKTSGNVRYEKGTVIVDDVYQIDGDVGPLTGNIQFEGSVNVKGNVLEGFHIEAKEDILIKGRVEGCNLTAGRNIFINDGINGMKKGLVQASGDVICKFIETGSVVCGGDFRCDVAINSNVDAGKSIIIKGERASLLGGEYVAGQSIIVRNVGSEKSIPVSLRITPHFEQEEIEIKEQMAEIKEKIEVLNEEIEELRRFDNISETISQKTVSIHRNMTEKEALSNTLSKLSKRLNDLQEQNQSEHYNIVCGGKIYNGVKIAIGSCSMRILDTLSHLRFYVSEGEIVSGLPLPSQTNG